MNVSEIEFKYMKEFMVRDLAMMLIRDLGMNIETALDAVYGSRTFELLCDRATGFFYQSPLYVYGYLREEIISGKFNPNPRYA